jgi:hypothetical protein
MLVAALARRHREVREELRLAHVLGAIGLPVAAVIGLSDRWREEGLGHVRHEIVSAAPAPMLFVRRGARPGALAPRTDVTRFTWSHVGAAAP